VAGDLERTALGIVMALERDDPAAMRELFFTEEGPVDDLDLIVTLGRLCVFMALESSGAGEGCVVKLTSRTEL
jgi:hypothetical protein